MTEVALVGAGIVGLSTAFALVEQGAEVAVYTRPRARARRGPQLLGHRAALEQ
jgi:glycine/D-amino acid oxidase-like deaminating enzyme